MSCTWLDEKLHDMTPGGNLIDVNVKLKIIKKDTAHIVGLIERVINNNYYMTMNISFI